MVQPELTISGGAGGVDACLEDLATLARGSDDLAWTLGRVSAECHAILADPDVLASAVLDPVGAAKFEAALLAALDGTAGLTSLAIKFGERALALRGVATAYQAADEAGRAAVDNIRWTIGNVFGPGVVLTAASFAASPLGLVLINSGLIDFQRLLTDHPSMVDGLVGAAPGLISNLPGMYVGDVTSAAHLLGMTYPDGQPLAVPADACLVPGTDASGLPPFIDTSDPSMTVPPKGFGDLIDGLDWRNRQAHADEPDEIDVRVITHADGSKAYIVDLPGTKVWDGPFQHEGALHDLGTNIHAMGDDTSTREKAIADALHHAGANSTDPVMIVGHSQGGIVAAQAAQHSATGQFDFNVTHVVTAGAPIGRIDIPGDVQVLALENQHDIVSHLDAADNPDRPNETTVTFASQNGDIGKNHSIGLSYLPVAQQLDSSTDPSITAFRDSAGDFLSDGTDGTTVQAKVYKLGRMP
jgi:hypothetical protein